MDVSFCAHWLCTVYGIRQSAAAATGLQIPPVTPSMWCGRSSSSVFGLPLINPLNQIYRIWNTIIIILDSTYTAFLVPILVGFNVSDVTWTWGCIVDLACGALPCC